MGRPARTSSPEVPHSWGIVRNVFAVQFRSSQGRSGQVRSGGHNKKVIGRRKSYPIEDAKFRKVLRQKAEELNLENIDHETGTKIIEEAFEKARATK